MKLFKKLILGILLIVFLLVGTLGLPSLTFAQSGPTPFLTVKYLAATEREGSWQDAINVRPGDRVGFYLEIHNTVVDSLSENTTVKVAFPTEPDPNTLTSQASVFSFTPGVNQAIDSVTLGLSERSKLVFRKDSTRITWDRDGDGVKEFDNSLSAGDEIVTRGINLGDLRGCNQFVVQMLFTADVVAVPLAVQAPPQPQATPPAQVVGQPPVQDIDQDVDQNVDVTVNPQITNTNTNTNTINVTQQPTVTVTQAAPRELPKTGFPLIPVAAGSAGVVPAGWWLTTLKFRRKFNKEEILRESLGLDYV